MDASSITLLAFSSVLVAGSVAVIVLVNYKRCKDSLNTHGARGTHGTQGTQGTQIDWVSEQVVVSQNAFS